MFARTACAAALAAILLAGCATTSNTGAGLVRPSLPPLPGRLAEPCELPAAIAGEDARAVAARGFAAAGACARRHRDTVRFYQDLSARLRQ